MIVVSTLLAYLLGALPTAQAIAKARGVDLRSDGSQNPGANNAMRLLGPSLAVPVLLAEMTKGAVAVLVAAAVAGEAVGDAAAVAAGVAAIAGNVYNVFYRFDGGKGLGIAGGVLLAAWPTVFVPIVVVIFTAMVVSRSSSAATSTAVLALDALAVLWAAAEWPTLWGVAPGARLVAFSLAVTALLWGPRKRGADVKTPRPASRSS